MKLAKMIMIVLSAMLIAAPAFAGSCPEYDAVGCDSQNYFALNAYVPLGMVCENNFGYVGDAGIVDQINCYSDFLYDDDENWGEKFTQNAGMISPDPCFPGYSSAMTPVWTSATYKWWIVLQMQPESDINVNIYDCVLKHNLTNIWTDAQQTGRYRTFWGEPFLELTANPQITVKALNGPYNNFGTFIMDARVLPGLEPVPVKDLLYTSKALFDEGIVLIMPKTGVPNITGQNMKGLKQGDMIKVKVVIPGNNTCDIRYGNDSVIVKYIGVVGNYMTDLSCGSCGL
ncbi:MAG: hypothetical protein U9Q92_07605 [archaeon]|nr:hypothetical protein [archaeon]